MYRLPDSCDEEMTASHGHTGGGYDCGTAMQPDIGDGVAR